MKVSGTSEVINLKTVTKCYQRLVLSEDEKNKLAEIGKFVKDELHGWGDLRYHNKEEYLERGHQGRIWNMGWQFAQGEYSFTECPEGYYHYLEYRDKEKQELLDMLQWAATNPKAPWFTSEVLAEIAKLFEQK
jgi:hypothetical protein